MFKPRRWPYITTVIIAINLVLFPITHEILQREAAQYSQIESRTLSIAAEYPQVSLSAAQRALVDEFQKTDSETWKSMQTAARSGSADEINYEITDLARELDDFQRNSVTARFSLYPPRRSLASNLTANFLYSDLARLLFTMCFLWLVAGALEDVWGLRVYSGILFFCMIVSPWAFSVVYPAVFVPPMGSSGMLAALMGFYVIRFPKRVIEHGTVSWVVRPRLLRFSSPVFVVFPAWLLGLAFWGKAAGDPGNAAYLAQAHTFAVGLGVGFLLWVTGLEAHVSESIDSQLCLSVDEHLAKAADYIEKGSLDAAINEVNAEIAEKPTSVEARELLANLYFRKGNALTKYLEALEGACEVHLRAAYPEAAWQDYDNYNKAGGRRMPSETWLQLARFVENQGDFERALAEYEELARTWPSERPSVLALIAAGRIHLQHFGRRDDAKRMYTAAKNSSVPHREWEDIILKGLQKATDPAVQGQSSGTVYRG